MFSRLRKARRPAEPANDDGNIIWGDIPLHPDEATSHYLAVGATGSGKTSIIRLLLQSVLPRFTPNGDNRALIYDAKQDALPLLSAMCPHVDIIPLNPFDQRGAAWDIAADIREPRAAIEIAYTLIPDMPESQPFFTNAARHLTFGVMASFMLSKRPWTFGDLLRVLKSPKLLKAILKRHRYTRSLLPLYFTDARLAANIMSSLATKYLPFEPIAAAWEHATRKVALHDWAHSTSILILPNAEISRAPIDAINRCIFKLATDIILNQSESTTRRTWFVIDELAAAGKLDGLVSLLKKGRSKGACAVIAFQSVAGLRDQHLYGNYIADELLGQIGNRFFGRLECPVTAQWASQLIGENEALMTTYNQAPPGIFGRPVTKSITRHWQNRHAVLPSELMTIPPCSVDNGLGGYFLTRAAGTFYATLDGENLFNRQLTPPSPIPEFLPRPAETQFLFPWTAQRLRVFGFRRKRPENTKTRTAPKISPEIDPSDLNDLFG